MPTRLPLISALLLALILCGLASTEASAQVTEEQVDQAIEKAIKYIWSQQQPDGFWPHHVDSKPNWHSNTGSIFDFGEMTMAAMAFEFSNTPIDDPKYQQVIGKVMEVKTNNNYVRSCRVLVLSHLYHRMPASKQPALRMAMKADVDHFVKGQHPDGGWQYDDRVKTTDLSNTQLVILALSEAAKCGVPVPRGSIIAAHRLMMTWQQEDGGWGYGKTQGNNDAHRTYGSMSAAGLASLFLTTEMITGTAGCPCQGSRSPVQKVDSIEAIGKGIQWLNENYNPRQNPRHGGYFYYWHYQVQRVGMATGLRYIGKADWYQKGAAAIISKQKADGSFGTVPDTAFAVLFLVKGRGTVLYNKLHFDGDWNLHPYDIRNVVDYIGQSKEITGLWQAIHSSTPVDLWHDAPIMFITSEGGFNPDDELKKKLRQYTDAGGTLLIEASCGNVAARKAWEDLIKEIWPQWELQKLDKDHPLWTADKQIAGRRPNLQHLSDGIRSIIFYSPADISCQWHINNVTRQQPLFDLAMNLPAYASDKAPLRLAISGSMIRPGRGLEGQTVNAPGGSKLVMARIKQPNDTRIGRHYRGMEQLAEFLNNTVKLKTELLEDVDAAQADQISKVDLLWLSGRNVVNLTETQKAGLKTYLEQGGFLVAESVLGDEDFAEPLAETLAAIGVTTKQLRPEHDLISGKFGSTTGYDLSSDVRFSRSLAIQRMNKPHAELVGLFMGDKMVGVHSPFDILYSLTGAPAWQRRGYQPDHAMALATNLALQAATAK